MILVVGGTGRLGRLVVDALVQAGEPVRVMARRLADLPDGVDGFAGDVRSVEDLRRALKGVDVVVSCVQGLVGRRVSPASVDRDGNLCLVRAARDAGVEVVLVSVSDAAPDSPVELFRAKYAAEEGLRASGVPWTVVRAAAFVETWVENLELSARPGHRPMLLGAGAVPTPWVAVADVAAVVVRAARDRSLRGRTVTVVGDQPLTLTDLARAVMRERGWPGEPRHLPPSVVSLLAATVGRVVPSAGRVLRMSVLLERLAPVLRPEPSGQIDGLAPTPLPLAVRQAVAA